MLEINAKNKTFSQNAKRLFQGPRSLADRILAIKPNTANLFCKWLLDWYGNQHLIIKLDLPVSKGISIEVADIIKFDELLGGNNEIKPYQINYTSESQLYGQTLFEKFIVTSTNKGLEKVSIECVQLHSLLDT